MISNEVLERIEALLSEHGAVTVEVARWTRHAHPWHVRLWVYRPGERTAIDYDGDGDTPAEAWAAVLRQLEASDGNR